MSGHRPLDSEWLPGRPLSAVACLSLLIAGGFIGVVLVEALRFGAGDSQAIRHIDGDPATMRAGALSIPGLESGRAESVSARAVAYQSVLGVQDSDSLERLIRQAATVPPTANSRFELELLLTRLLEIDPPRAVSLVRELKLPNLWLAFAIQQWVELDADGAVARLRTLALDGPATHAAGVALLNALGGDESAMARVLQALPAIDELSLRIGGLVSLAEHDIGAAILGSAQLPDRASRRVAVESIGQIAGYVDPQGALMYADLLPEWEHRLFFANRVMERWAELDPHGFISHLDSLSPDPWNVTRVEQALRVAAAADPEYALEAVGQLPATWRTAAEYLVIEVLAQQNPDAAMAFVESLRPGEPRSRLLHALASGLALADADAAIAWARSLGSSSADLADAILTAVASTDLHKAIDIALSVNLPRGSTPRHPVWLITALRSDPGQAASIAERLISSGSGGGRLDDLFRRTVTQWAIHDAESALAWLNARGALDTATLRPVATEMGRQDLHYALGQAAFLPAHLREEWIRAAISSPSATDPRSVVDAMATLRGQPVYDSTIAGLALSALGRHSPQLALELLGNASVATQERTFPSLAMRWVTHEPAAAVQWAAGLTDPDTRQRTVSAAITVWSYTDPEAVAEWIGQLPQDEIRQLGLTHRQSELSAR